MSYSEQAAVVSQQIIRAADRTTRVKAALDILAKLDVGAEITDDDTGTIIYIPRVR
jgi:hypothetical protein